MTVTFDGHGTLHHGDCLKVLPTLADGSVDLVVADLPYGITANLWDCAIPLDRLWPALRRVGKSDCVFVFTATMRFACALINSQPHMFRYDLVWEKNFPSGFLNSNLMPLRSHESILVFCSGKTPYNPQKTTGKPYAVLRRGASENYNKGTQRLIGQYRDGMRYPQSVLKFAHAPRLPGRHPTQKPIELLSWVLRTYSRPGDTVLDPTSGVASTACAAIRDGRRFVCIENDSGYHAVAKERVAAEVAATRPEAKALGGTLAARAMAWAEERRRQAGSGQA